MGGEIAEPPHAEEGGAHDQQRPPFADDLLPGLLSAGAGAGLTEAPLFAATGTLPPDRATTGAAVLTMSRQLGSAIGIAMLVALLASSHPGALGEFHRGWLLIMAAAAGAAFAVALVGLRGARTRPSSLRA